jgi:hypothetical protein
MDCEKIRQKLKKNNIASVLLNKFSLNSENDYKSSELSDPMYLPFYYYLGQDITPSSCVEFGLGLGICSGSFLCGCPSVKSFTAFQNKTKEYYPDNMTRHNIRRVYKDKFYFYYGQLDEGFKKLVKDQRPQIVFIREKDKEKMSEYLNFAWDVLNYDVIFVVDYIDVNPEIFNVFCKVRNRNFEKFNTRYGVGIITK